MLTYADRASDVRLEGCAVGGLLAYDVDGRLCKAARAVSLVKQARMCSQESRMCRNEGCVCVVKMDASARLRSPSA